MSYDFQLLPCDRAAALLAEYEAQSADADLEINPGPIIPDREKWKASTRDALLTAEPRFEPFAFGFSEIAAMYGISEAEARVRYRHIELNLPDQDRSGIQVTLYDDTGTVTVPYWHTGAAATDVMARIWSYLRVLESSGRLVTHDPQLGRIINLETDFDDVLSRYLSVSVRVTDIINQPAPMNKPWWRFW
jgi:hypothetical protein